MKKVSQTMASMTFPGMLLNGFMTGISRNTTFFLPKENPQGPEKGQYKIIRGGNWRNTALSM